MFSNQHNLVSTRTNGEKRHGIRVSLAENDPFRRLVAEDWESFHWFTGIAERDAALHDMRRRHEYSRIGDSPVVQYEPIDR